MSITIKKVESKSDLMKFIKMQWSIYKDNPYWVPPLIMDRKKILSKEKNPFYKHSEIELFLAYKDEEIVGRIAAIKNDNHNKIHNDKVGFWGFFESIKSQEVANKLFDAVKDWLKSKGLDTMRGPANPSSNDDWGLLIKGFDDSPRILMPYNPEYYIELCDNYGFKKDMDLYAWKISYERMSKSEKVFRIAEIARKRYNVQVRKINFKDMDNEIERIKLIYNKAWELNWGFVPLNDDEMDAMAKDLKQLADPDLALFAEIDKNPIGFALALPDYNIIFKEMNGKLFPFNIIKLFTHKKKINWLRIIILGLLPEYRNRGIDSILYNDIFYNAYAKGIKLGEASWILETNDKMNKAIEDVMLGEKYKEYRIYSKKID